METTLGGDDDGAAAADRAPDPALIKAVARGHAWIDDLVHVGAETDPVGAAAAVAGELITSRYLAALERDDPDRP